MTDDIMARPDGTGSRASTEPASGLGPSGFDPSRGDGNQGLMPAGMKPWAGGNEAPADWDGGRVLFRDGTLSVQAPQWVWRWKQPPYFRDIVAYTPRTSTPAS